MSLSDIISIVVIALAVFAAGQMRQALKEMSGE